MLYEDHIGSRDHDLPDDGVAELEDRMDHGALARLDDAPAFEQVD